MKNWMRWAFWVGMIAVLLLNAAYADETAGTVKSVKGEVNIVRAGSPIKAWAGFQLKSSDKIVTGTGSSIGITLQDATLLSFGPNSVSQLNEFRYDPIKRDGNLLITVLKGSMRFVTGLLGKHNPESVAIHSPGATLGIRGTDFIVSVEGGE